MCAEKARYVYVLQIDVNRGVYEGRPSHRSDEAAYRVTIISFLTVSATTTTTSTPLAVLASHLEYIMDMLAYIRNTHSTIAKKNRRKRKEMKKKGGKTRDHVMHNIRVHTVQCKPTTDKSRLQ